MTDYIKIQFVIFNTFDHVLKHQQMQTFEAFYYPSRLNIRQL